MKAKKKSETRWERRDDAEGIANRDCLHHAISKIEIGWELKD
jgi:hypothetical protein